jgi:hypothetical protein
MSKTPRIRMSLDFVSVNRKGIGCARASRVRSCRSTDEYADGRLRAFNLTIVWTIVSGEFLIAVRHG